MGVLPSRKLGQNFLTDQNVAAWIVRQLEPAADDCVVEVGPGLGALSDHLAGKVRRLVLLEKDHRLAEGLRNDYADTESVELVEGDACDFDVRPLYAEGPVKLIGNLPYSAAGEIMRMYLDHPTPCTGAVLMLQKEMADRLIAKPRTKDYGVLTLLIQQRWQAQVVKVVPPQVFHPIPKVDSSVVKLTPLPADAFPPFDRAKFEQLVKAGFSQRRKQVRKLLPPLPKDWEEIVAAVGCSPTARAEEIPLEGWVELARIYSGAGGDADLGQRDDEIFDVVDENDEVIRQEKRAVVHAEGLTHRAVHILVVNPAGEVYLQKRSHLKDTMPLRWDSSAAGHVDAGEDYDTSAARELEEELGIKPWGLEMIEKISPCENTGWEFVGLYLAKAQAEIRFAPNEIDTGGFFPPEIIDDWVKRRPEDFAPGFWECWRRYRGRDV